MSILHTNISPVQLPADSFTGRILLVLSGLIFTAVTQSSSAGVAATLTALNTGTIEFSQAASLVIGMDIGTTVTAVLATIGSSTAARRTGVSHLCYNLFSASMAFLLLTPYIMLWQWLAPGLLDTTSEFALVAFHSSYNTFAVLLILPFSNRFVYMMERLIPEKKSSYTFGLETSMLTNPELAFSALHKVLVREFNALLLHTYAILSGKHESRKDLSALHRALEESQSYLEQIHMAKATPTLWPGMVTMIHTLDHMVRLHERCEEEEDRAIRAREAGILRQVHSSLCGAVLNIQALVDKGEWKLALNAAEKISQEIHDRLPALRQEIMHALARGELGRYEGTGQLQAIRWMNRVAKHIASATRYLNEYISTTVKQ